MDVVSAIKEVVRDYLNNEKLSDVVYGTYTGGKMKIDNRPLPIPMDMIVLPQGMKERKVKAVVDGAEREITIKEKLSDGERFILFQQHGGQRFTVVGRL